MCTPRITSPAYLLGFHGKPPTEPPPKTGTHWRELCGGHDNMFPQLWAADSNVVSCWGKYWQLAVGGWWRWVAVGGGCWLARLVVGGWRLVALGSGWWLVVGGWQSLGAILEGGTQEKTKLGSLKTPLCGGGLQTLHSCFRGA